MTGLVDFIFNGVVDGTLPQKETEEAIKNAMDVSTFCKEIGMTSEDMNIYIDNPKTNPDASSLNIDDYIELKKYYFGLKDLLAKHVSYDVIVDYIQHRPRYIYKKVEYAITLLLLDEAAGRIWDKYDTFGDFLNSINEELFDLLPHLNYFSKMTETDKQQMAFVLRLSWEVNYIYVINKEVRKLKVNENATSDESGYKKRELDKLKKRIKKEKISSIWFEDKEKCNQNWKDPNYLFNDYTFRALMDLDDSFLQ